MRFKMSDYGFVTDVQVRFGNNVLLSYYVWTAMIARCYNIKNKGYKTYGRKGVYICDEWKLYSNFKRWYDENYIEGCEIDKDISGKRYYGPDSCRFISKTENIKEARDRQDYGYMAGENHVKSNSITYYENNSSTRVNFKKICSRQGWMFDDFKETLSHTYRTPKGKIVHKYFYKTI